MFCGHCSLEEEKNRLSVMSKQGTEKLIDVKGGRIGGNPGVCAISIETADDLTDIKTLKTRSHAQLLTMLASRRLVTLVPRRTFSTTTLPHLSPALSQSTPTSPSRTLPRPSPLAHHHHGPKGCAQTRPRSSSSPRGSKDWEARDAMDETLKKPVQKVFPKYIEPGDWICGPCQAHNFRTRHQCFECREPNSLGAVFYLEGSWKCPTCTLYVPCKDPPFLSASHDPESLADWKSVSLEREWILFRDSYSRWVYC